MTDLKQQLSRQLTFLERSCKEFDAGHYDEAIRMSVTLRVLLHDTPRSTSLLHHLGSNNILLLSTAILPARPEPVSLALVTPIIQLHSLSATTKPLFATSPRHQLVHFINWWRKEPVIALNNGNDPIYRRDLILNAANKDGGAHVDKVQDPLYDTTRLGAGMSVEFCFKHGLPSHEVPFENIHYASLRQIAYEVLNSQSILALN